MVQVEIEDDVALSASLSIEPISPSKGFRPAVYGDLTRTLTNMEQEKGLSMLLQTYHPIIGHLQWLHQQLVINAQHQPDGFKNFMKRLQKDMVSNIQAFRGYPIYVQGEYDIRTMQYIVAITCAGFQIVARLDERMFT